MGMIEEILTRDLGEDWESQIDSVKILFIPPEVMKIWFRAQVEYNGWKGPIYWRFGRGFAVGNVVFITKGTTSLELVAHEVGHTNVMGNKKHRSWTFGIMHPTGLFRWFINPFITLWNFYKQWRIEPEYDRYKDILDYYIKDWAKRKIDEQSNKNNRQNNTA